MTAYTNATNVEEAARTCRDVVERIDEAAIVDPAVRFEILSAVIARGHVLLEDMPGTGKTVTARILAESLGLEFRRIQFTPDLLPSDITGSNVYNEHDQTFEFFEGPVFTNIVLADEINRAPPKTQAALLEAMEEGQVSVDGTTHDLPDPFVVVATQNPIEQEGTFRLPEAQRDRFAVKTSLGYPDVDGEMELLDRRANRRTLAPSVDSVVSAADVRELQDLAEDVRVTEKLRRYIIDLARETRDDERTAVGVSPRGVQRIFELARAVAVVDGRAFALPDDVKRLAESAMAHRLVLTTEATVEGVDARAIVRDALESVDVPAVSPHGPTADESSEGEPGEAEMPAGDQMETERAERVETTESVEIDTPNSPSNDERAANDGESEEREPESDERETETDDREPEEGDGLF